MDQKPMSVFGELLAEQAVLAGEAARIHGKIGRQFFAREVMAWARERYTVQNAADMEALLALCRKELTP